MSSPLPASTAQRIVEADRTPRERRDMCDFWARKIDWPASGPSRDLCTYTFEDGSQVMMTLDESLQPVEWIAVN